MLADSEVLSCSCASVGGGCTDPGADCPAYKLEDMMKLFEEEEGLLEQKKEGTDVDVADVATDVAAGTKPHRSIAGMKRGILGKIRKTNEEMVKLLFFIYSP